MVKCGLRQGGVLSPYLFALYVDELITQLTFQLWFTYWSTVCRLCLLCRRYCFTVMPPAVLERLINICEKYGTEWDIRFNPTKSQLITFGGPNPSACGIHIQYIGSTK